MPSMFKIPAFKTLLILVPCLILGRYINFSSEILFLGVGASVIAAILLYKYQHQFAAYFILLLCSGLMISYMARSNRIDFPKKVIPDTDAIFTGKIKKIIKKGDSYIRLIADGKVDIKGLPAMNNQNIMLTCFIRDTSQEYLYVKQGAEFYSAVKLTFQPPGLLPDEFDYDKYLKTNGINWNCITKAEDFSIKRSPDRISEILNHSRDRINFKIHELFPDYSANIIRAMVLGDKSGIDQDTKQSFSYAGTAHLLAISGLHIGIIASAIHFLLIPFFKHRILKFLIFSIVLILFIALSGFQASAVRAGAMAILWSISYLTTRRIEPINAASVVILLMLIIYPSYIYSVSFQMSSSAIIGILLFYNVLRDTLNKFNPNKNLIAQFAINSLSMTLSASLVVSPLVAYYFGVFSIISPIANLIVLPLMSLALVYTIIALISSFLWIQIAALFANTAMFLIEISDILNRYFAELPNAYVESYSASLFISFVFLVLVIYFAFSNGKRQAVFRLSISVSVFIITIYASSFLFIAEIDPVRIFPRNQFTIVEIEESDSTRIILIDRKPSQYARSDFALVNYLKNSSKPLKLYYSGNSGINAADLIKKDQNIISSEISIHIQRKLKDVLGLKKELSQIIE